MNENVFREFPKPAMMWHQVFSCVFYISIISKYLNYLGNTHIKVEIRDFLLIHLFS